MIVPLTATPCWAADTDARAKVVVVTRLVESDFIARSGIRMRKRGIPMIDYDFTQAFTQELMSRLAADKRAQYRLAAPDDAVPTLPPAVGKSLLPGKVYKQSVPAGLDAVRILRVDIESVGSQSALGANFYSITGTMVMLNRAGKVVWSQRDHVGNAITVRVSGSIEEHQADGQRAMKENIDKIIERYCSRKADKLIAKHFKD